MEALRFTFKDKKVELARIPIPCIEEPDQVLVRVAYAGICGTDLHILAGEFPCNKLGSIILGHEISGIVEKTGESVVHIREGDKVTINPNSGCNRCSFCHAGKPHFCKRGCVINTIGIYKDGGWATFVLCPEEQIHKLVPGINLEHAVLTEPISCIAHAWDLLSPVTVGEKILVLSGGITGTLWLCILHHQGHRNVVAIEPNVPRLETLRRLNTGYTLLTPTQLKKNTAAHPDKYVFDVVVDCSGTASAIEEAVGLLNFGGKLCIFGVAPPTNKIQLSPFDIYKKEIKIIGVNVNPFTFPKAMGLIEAMGNRYLNSGNLGIKFYSLSQYKEAVEQIKKGNVAKAVFKM